MVLLIVNLFILSISASNSGYPSQRNPFLSLFIARLLEDRLFEMLKILINFLMWNPTEIDNYYEKDPVYPLSADKPVSLNQSLIFDSQCPFSQ